MKYDSSKFTWGYELEFGDIGRDVVIPDHLGKWEYAETDIVNLTDPYRGLACDPLGISPPVGGEINTKPTKTWKEQVDRINEIISLFRDLKQEPTASCVNHGHLHVFVPGLKEDIESLKKLIRYIKENQHITIEKCYQFRLSPLMNSSKTAKTYLKWDGGRPMPDYMCDNITKLANNFDDFIRLHAAGKDGVSMGRPFRYAINTYCMKHTGTIEFRCFRSSVNEQEIADSFKFVEKFISAALNDGPNVDEILLEDKFQFPKFEYDHDMYIGWEKTKYDKSRGKKQREFYEVYEKN
jgi:hypothetical protein